MSDAPDSYFEDEPRLGALLREAREARGLELGEIAGSTNVRREYLAALEEGRYTDLPEDVYTKNFLRLFAQAVGFDVVRAQELYRSERRDANGFNTVERRLEHDRGLAAEVPPLERRTRWWEGAGPGPRWGAFLSTILMVVAVVGLALWGFNSTFFSPGRTAPADDATSPRPGATSPVAADEEAEANQLPRTVRLSVSSTPPGAEVSVDEFPLPGTTPIQSAPVTARPSRTIRVALDGYVTVEGEFDLTFDRNLSFALSPTPVETPAGAAEGVAAGDEEPPAVGAAATPGQPQATLRVTEDTWLEVYQGTARNQGERLAFATARAGQSLRFQLPIYIHMGNAGGVELIVDGQERGALGSSGEVRGLAVTQ